MTPTPPAPDLSYGTPGTVAPLDHDGPQDEEVPHVVDAPEDQRPDDEAPGPPDQIPKTRSYGRDLDLIVILAAVTARRLNSPQVGTEHLLLELLDDNSALLVLRRLGVVIDLLRRRVLAALPDRPEQGVSHPELVPQARKALALAMEESEPQPPGPPHLLLGLIREQESPAAQALRKAGLTLEKVRAEVRRAPDPPAPVPPSKPRRKGRAPRRIVRRALAVPAWALLFPVALVCLIVAGIVEFMEDSAYLLLALIVLIGVLGLVTGLSNHNTTSILVGIACLVGALLIVGLAAIAEPLGESLSELGDFIREP